MEKKILLFNPSIEGGGVEKNLFLISKFLIKKFKKVSIITISKNQKKKFNKSIEFISLSSNIWDRYGRKFKYFLALILLIKEILNNKNLLVFSFQANIYCIIVCKLFGVKVISRSNSAPSGWSQNWLKRNIFKIVLNLADKVMVNSKQFKKNLKSGFITQNLLNDYSIGILTVIIENKVLKKFFFNQNFNVIGDFDLFLKLSKKYKIAYLNEPLAIYN